MNRAMNTLMKPKTRYIFPIIFVAIACLSGCGGSNPTPTASDNNTPAPVVTTPPSGEGIPSPTPTTTVEATPTPTPTQTPTEKKTTKQQAANTETKKAQKAISPKTVKVTVYTSDDQCQSLVPKEVTVSGSEPVGNAVGEIIKERDTADFSVSGYRVNIKDGVATVDLRVAPDSKREVSSLSSCEQFALFQSVEKTLTSNPSWGIKDVRFTEKGKEIIF